MPAYIVVDSKPLDQDKLANYAAHAGPSVQSFGGEFLCKGAIQSLHGETEFQSKLIIQFPDQASALGWYNSDAYQALIELRNQAMHSQFHLIVN